MLTSQPSLISSICNLLHTLQLNFNLKKKKQKNKKNYKPKSKTKQNSKPALLHKNSQHACKDSRDVTFGSRLPPVIGNFIKSFTFYLKQLPVQIGKMQCTIHAFLAVRIISEPWMNQESVNGTCVIFL